MKNLLILILLFTGQLSPAQQIKDFFYLEPESKNLPVFIRGSLESNKILLYVQGGGAENGIDFGRSDYPIWQNTLEKEVAIAYFDQRGLNRNVKKIDTSKINAAQVLKDIISIAKSLKEKYQADIYLFGHSMGGVDVLRCLASFPKETAFIKSGIVFNTPITSDFSPERYNYYRPLYLKNLAEEFINKGKDANYWQEAYDWMSKTDSIASIEASRKWNAYVDHAYAPIKRKISLGMLLKTIFARPYNPIKYLNHNDNKFVADKLWYADKAHWDMGKQNTMWEILPDIEHPVLILSGRYDAIAVPEEQKEAQQLIKHSELVIIPDCGHESFLDQPQLFNNAVISFCK